MWLMGVIVFFTHPVSNPPFLVTEASLSKSPFLPPLRSPPPPPHPWSCSSRSAQSDKTLLLCFFLWRGGGEMSELTAPLADPLFKTVSMGTTSAYLPKVPRQSYWNYDMEPSPCPILTDRLRRNFQAKKNQLGSCFITKGDILAAPHGPPTKTHGKHIA